MPAPVTVPTASTELAPAWMAVVLLSISIRFGFLDNVRGLAAVMAGVCLISGATWLGMFAPLKRASAGAC